MCTRTGEFAKSQKQSGHVGQSVNSGKNVYRPYYFNARHETAVAYVYLHYIICIHVIMQLYRYTRIRPSSNTFWLNTIMDTGGGMGAIPSTSVHKKSIALYSYIIFQYSVGVLLKLPPPYRFVTYVLVLGSTSIYLFKIKHAKVSRNKTIILFRVSHEDLSIRKTYYAKSYFLCW